MLEKLLKSYSFADQLLREILRSHQCYVPHWQVSGPMPLMALSVTPAVTTGRRHWRLTKQVMSPFKEHCVFFCSVQPGKLKLVDIIKYVFFIPCLVSQSVWSRGKAAHFYFRQHSHSSRSYKTVASSMALTHLCKERILHQEKQQKLQLYKRSHFSLHKLPTVGMMHSYIINRVDFIACDFEKLQYFASRNLFY